MARRSAAALTVVVALIGIPGTPASAATHHLRTVTDVTVQCVTTPQFPGGPTGPVTRTFHIVAEAPSKVSRRAAAEATVSIDYTVSTGADVGAIALDVTQNGASTRQFVTVGPGAPALEGTATVPVTAKPGSSVTWSIAYWGQAAFFGSVTIQDVCTPAAPIVIAKSRVTG